MRNCIHVSLLAQCSENGEVQGVNFHTEQTVCAGSTFENIFTIKNSTYTSGKEV
jgi:hypothetical protein